MRKRNIIAALVAGGLTLASTSLLAQEAGAPAQSTQPGQDYKPDAKPSQDPAPTTKYNQNTRHTERTDALATPSCHRASHIIGMEVRTDMGDRLGKVQDLIVSLDSDRAPFAIVHYGGALGIGGTRVAVPLRELKLSDDQKMLTLAANKDQFVSASTAPTGAWAAVADQEWAKTIDRFYGQPATMGWSRFERQDMEFGKEGHEFVRNPADRKGANALVNQIPSVEQSITDPALRPAENQISTQVTKLIDRTVGNPSGQNIQVSVEKGVVTLKGKIADADLQRKLDDQIKALPGVERVDDQLTVSAKEY